MWVFPVLQTLCAGFKNAPYPSSFYGCLGFLRVFQQKWVQTDGYSPLLPADPNWEGSPAMDKPVWTQEMTTYPFDQGCHVPWR